MILILIVLFQDIIRLNILRWVDRAKSLWIGWALSHLSTDVLQGERAPELTLTMQHVHYTIFFVHVPWNQWNFTQLDYVEYKI